MQFVSLFIDPLMEILFFRLSLSVSLPDQHWSGYNLSVLMLQNGSSCNILKDTKVGNTIWSIHFSLFSHIIV